MLFSSLVFLHLFLPLVILGNFILPFKYRNAFLVLSSFIFFAWGGVSYSFLLIISLLINYITGLLIGKNPDSGNSKTFLVIGIILNLTLLGIFKYLNFIVANINTVSSIIGIEELPNPGIILPIGISFYTFQAISYIIDVYRRETNVQRNFINLSLYISLFPQLIAGPIVRYHDISKQIVKRENNLDNFLSGIKRFGLGLARKILIANQFAVVADEIFSMDPSGLPSFAAWLAIIAYTLQIYFDFAGYSDMAIGLGRMFGFRILENFNFPYLAESIRDFWRRWHISLSNWFRDYLYVPLGGNRSGKYRTLINLLIVFIITGFWHGANWTFLIWGLIHGTFLILERLRFNTILMKFRRPFRHFYALMVVTLAWVMFRADTVEYAISFYKAMFAFSNSGIDSTSFLKYLNVEFVIVLIIAVLSSTTIFAKSLSSLRKKIQAHKTTAFNTPLILLGILEVTFLTILFFLCTMSLTANTYNPFIYFRF